MQCKTLSAATCTVAYPDEGIPALRRSDRPQDRQEFRQAGTQTCRQADERMDGQTDRQTPMERIPQPGILVAAAGHLVNMSWCSLSCCHTWEGESQTVRPLALHMGAGLPAGLYLATAQQ